MTRTGRKSNGWDNDEKDNYDGGDGGGDDGGGVFFERAQAKCQSLRMLRYLTATLGFIASTTAETFASRFEDENQLPPPRLPATQLPLPRKLHTPQPRIYVSSDGT